MAWHGMAIPPRAHLYLCMHVCMCMCVALYYEWAMYMEEPDQLLGQCCLFMIICRSVLK